MPDLTGYAVVSVREMLKELESSEQSGESRVKAILSSFRCPMNQDVEQFIRTKAVEFDRQALARTYVVLTSYQKKPVLVGYFTIALKSIQIEKTALNRNTRDRIKRFASYSKDTDTYTMSSPLIAQLGKNYANGYNQLITGDELFTFALEKVSEIHFLGGGKIVYLECEETENLIRFYQRHGFVTFGKRPLDGDERGLMQSRHLVQMLKYCR